MEPLTLVIGALIAIGSGLVGAGIGGSFERRRRGRHEKPPKT